MTKNRSLLAKSGDLAALFLSLTESYSEPKYEIERRSTVECVISLVLLVMFFQDPFHH